MTDTKRKLSKVRPVRLNFKDAATPVVVTAEDQDAFVVSMEAAVDACRNVDRGMQWREEFKKFLAHINRWSRDHEQIVAQVFVSPTPSIGLDVYVVTRGGAYRPEFDDAVTHLDLELFGTFKNCPAHVTQLPDEGFEALASFFNPVVAMQVYGD